MRPGIAYLFAAVVVVGLLLNAQSNRYHYVEGGPGDGTLGFVMRFDNWTGEKCFAYPPNLKSC